MTFSDKENGTCAILPHHDPKEELHIPWWGYAVAAAATAGFYFYDKYA